jgi:hypothetical protein
VVVVVIREIHSCSHLRLSEPPGWGTLSLLLTSPALSCATGWDLEQNKVIKHYHGHLSGVYSCALHPTLDILVTGGRDSVARVREAMRTTPGRPLCVVS